MDDLEHPTIGDLVAALDQLDASLRDVGQILGDHRRRLVEAGFDPEEALELCIEVQRAVIFHS